MTDFEVIAIENLEALKLGHIGALQEWEISAIVIDNVAPKDMCEQYCTRIRQYCESSDYKWANDLKAIGRSIGEAHESKALEVEYFSGASTTQDLYKESIFNGVSPVGHIRSRLEAIFPNGVETAKIGEDKFLPEIVRRWKEQGGAHPHIDQRNTPLLSPLQITDRFGINTYLSMPPEGGEIEFWRRPMSDEEYLSLKRTDYGLDRDILGAPSLKLKPSTGQAVIFRADGLHAVSPINPGRSAISPSEDRITNASFICFRANGATPVMFA